MPTEGVRLEALAPAQGGERQAGFSRIDPAASGLAFTNLIPETRHLTNQVLLNGSGLAAADVDGDGRTDVFCAGFDNDNALFRNQGGWRFREAAGEAGVALPGVDCTGAAFADFDGDGDMDLVVNTLGQGTRILDNDGSGRFTARSQVLNPGRAGMTAAIADIDGDGWLDLYIANYRTRALMDMPGTRMTFKKVGARTVVDLVNGRPAATDPEFAGRFVVNEHGGIEENGEPDVLYRNVGGTNFVEVPWTGGAFLDETGAPLREAPAEWGLAAMFRDVNGDGRPDLYVCNDFQSPDRLWLNQGAGRFRLAPPPTLRRTSLSSMAVDFADVNRDGHDDFLVLEMMSRDHGLRMRWVRENFPHRPVVGRYEDRPQIEQNVLQLGRGDGTWAEVAQLAGLEAAEWAWSCAFLDVDLDGWEDLLAVNGMERAGRDLDAAERLKASRAGKRLTEMQIFEGRKMFPRLATPNLAFRNRGDLTFQEVGRDWGFDLAAISQAMALADLDQDGDLDVLVGNLNAAVAVYRNESAAPRVAVRLVGRRGNSRGIGARIEVHAPLREGSPPTPLSQEMTAGGRYLSSDDPQRTFATLDAAEVEIRVQWPGGARSVVPGVRPNARVEIREPEPSKPDVRVATPAVVGIPGWRFEDRSEGLAHRHLEEAFDDFARQPLLPHNLSQPGPGVAWVDLDGDGDDDLVIGEGKPGRLTAFRNEGGGRLAPWDVPALRGPWSRDVTSILGLPRPQGPPLLLAALANYEDGAALGPALVAWDGRAAAAEELATAWDSSVGPMASADIDGDGDLDLFLGGRAVPGRWPAAAESRFLRNDAGRFVVDAERSRILKAIGLVSGATFADLDGDGDADLALACEWGPVRVLLQERDGFREATEALGLSDAMGWWTSVAAGDFDGDGRMDMVAGNWGRNTPYQRHRAGGPLTIHHGDLNGDGIYDVIEGHVDAAVGREVPGQPLGVLAQSLPQLRERFPTHAAFGAALLSDVLAAAGAKPVVERATVLESTVFLRRGGRFEARPLPVEAQFAPVFGLAVADADGDGREDVFLAQNFFAVRPHTPRYDGGAGLWLRGDGRGGFTAVNDALAGMRLLGEQRGAAVADFDADGRVDLVVGQNGAATRLFRNVGAKPGVRVRLVGSAANPAGVGARLRWRGESHPVREVTLGGGYLSQGSVVPVLGRPDGATVLIVEWPGGGRTELEVASGATEVTARRTAN